MRHIWQAEVQLILPEARKCMSWTCEVPSSPVFSDSANLSLKLTQHCPVHSDGPMALSPYGPLHHVQHRSIWELSATCHAQPKGAAWVRDALLRVNPGGIFHANNTSKTEQRGGTVSLSTRVNTWPSAAVKGVCVGGDYHCTELHGGWQSPAHLKSNVWARRVGQHLSDPTPREHLSGARRAQWDAAVCFQKNCRSHRLAATLYAQSLGWTTLLRSQLLFSEWLAPCEWNSWFTPT